MRTECKSHAEKHFIPTQKRLAKEIETRPLRLPCLQFYLICHECRVIINIALEPALSFFKSFPWKCSTPLNGLANAVAVMFWTAALLQDKLSCAMCLSVDFLAQRLRGRACQLVTTAQKSLINILPFGGDCCSSVTFPLSVPGHVFSGEMMDQQNGFQKRKKKRKKGKKII